MASDEDLARIRQGGIVWNDWRAQNREDHVDLTGADFSGADLSGIDLFGVDLSGVNFERADLRKANLTYAKLTESNLSRADLTRAKLVGTNFVRADLHEADLTKVVVNGANFRDANLHAANLSNADLGAASFVTTDLSNARLTQADLSYSRFIETNLEGADLTGCRIYGISVWNVRLTGALQSNLIITDRNEPSITVDNLEVSQFIYLLLHSEKMRGIIETITSKMVLILGRFTPERKAVLDAVRDELRQRNYLPVVFDFEKPVNQTTEETVTLLARMARFVIADISDAKSVLQELSAIVPNIPSLPVQPIIVATQEEPGMFDFFRRYPWVLKPYRYRSQKELIADLSEGVIRPAEAKVRKLRR